MRILFITERYRPEIGGVAASATRISRSMADAGHEVHVFTLARSLPAAQVKTEMEDGVGVHRFGPARNLDLTLQQALNFLEWLHFHEPVDLVWGHYAQTAGFLATWFGQLHERPSVVSVRGNDLDKQLLPPGDFGRLRWTLEKADHVATVSADLARKVRALTGREAVVLPNSVDTETFQPGPPAQSLVEHYRIEPPQVVLGFSGELRVKKGLGFLVEAFRQVLARQPARLLIIGEVRGKDRGEYERWLSGDDRLSDQVIVTGHLDDPTDVVAHLRLADVFLLPSIWEGMPNSLLEAMATGIPVIASTAGAIPEVVTDGRTGMLLPKTHLHQLGERVDEMLALAADARQALTRRAREYVVQHHSLAAESERLADLLARLVPA